jgi:hypothetical protein
MSFTREATCAEMQGHVARIVSVAPADSRKAAISFAAKVLRISYSRCKKLFYGEPLRVEAHEADQIRAYVTAAQKLIEARDAYDATRREYLCLASSDARLLAKTPDPLPRTPLSEVAEVVLAVANGTAEHVGRPDAAPEKGR